MCSLLHVAGWHGQPAVVTCGQEVAQEPAQNSVQKRTLADRRTPFEWVNHVYLCRLEFMLQALLFFSLVREEKHGIPLSFHAALLSVSTDAVVMPVIPAQSGCSQADKCYLLFFPQ